MSKIFNKYTGDAFTKIGGGIFGGGVVALYFNYLVLKPEDGYSLILVYVLPFIIGISLMTVGYKIKG